LGRSKGVALEGDEKRAYQRNRTKGDVPSGHQAGSVFKKGQATERHKRLSIKLNPRG